VVVTNEDDICQEGVAGDSPGINVDQRRPLDKKAAMTQPLNTVYHAVFVDFCLFAVQEPMLTIPEKAR
jgi:hypothetical protein